MGIFSSWPTRRAWTPVPGSWPVAFRVPITTWIAWQSEYRTARWCNALRVPTSPGPCIIHPFLPWLTVTISSSTPSRPSSVLWRPRRNTRTSHCSHYRCQGSSKRPIRGARKIAHQGPGRKSELWYWTWSARKICYQLLWSFYRRNTAMMMFVNVDDADYVWFCDVSRRQSVCLTYFNYFRGITIRLLNKNKGIGTCSHAAFTLLSLDLWIILHEMRPVFLIHLEKFEIFTNLNSENRSCQNRSCQLAKG